MAEIPALRVIRAGETLATEVCARLFAGFGHEVADLGIDQLEGSLGDADVLLTDITAPDVTLFGREYAHLLGRWPQLIVTSITSFGLSGSLAGQRGDSLLAEAYGGLATMIGEPDRRPLALGGEQAAYASAIAAFLGSCLALLDRDRGGQGQLVDVAMCDVVAYIDWKSDIVLQTDGVAPVRTGTDGAWKLVPCADGHVGIIYQPSQWNSLCDLVGSERLREIGRGSAAGPAATQIFRDWARTLPGREIYRLAQARGLPFGYCASIADLLESEQYRARHFFPGPGGRGGTAGDVVRLPVHPMIGAAGSVPAERAEPHQPGSGRSGAPLRPDDTSALPLHGVLVLDLGTITAGAAVGRLLADYGATVIKVEAPEAPDLFRSWDRPRLGPAEGKGSYVSPFFESNNVSKLGLGINLKSARGRQIFLELARQADVVLENFSLGVTGRLGIDFDELRQLNPRLLYLSLSSQGRSGPESANRSYGSTIDLLSGLASVTGYGPDEPLWSSRDVNYPDQIAALFGAAALVHALFGRATGHLDVSQREVVSWTLERYIRDTTATGVSPSPSGNNRGAPWVRDTFPTADGRWVAISCLTAADEAALARLTGAGTATANDRRDTYAAIAAWTSARTTATCLRQLSGSGIPSAGVLDAQVRAATARFYERQVFDHVPDGVNRGLRVKGTPFVMSRVRPRITRHAPSLGQDTEKILAALLGIDNNEYADPRRAGL